MRFKSLRAGLSVYPWRGKTEEHAGRFVLLTFALKKTHYSREKVNGGRRRTGRRHSESAFYW